MGAEGSTGKDGLARRNRNRWETVRLNPEPELVTVVVGRYRSVLCTTLRWRTKKHTPRNFRIEQPPIMLRELGLDPKIEGNGNGLGLGKTPRCAITGKPTNFNHLYRVGSVLIW